MGPGVTSDLCMNERNKPPGTVEYRQAQRVNKNTKNCPVANDRFSDPHSRTFNSQTHI